MPYHRKKSDVFISLWKVRGLPNVTLAWMVFLDRVSTRTNLSRRGVDMGMAKSLYVS